MRKEQLSPIELTKEEAVEIVIGHLESKLNEIVPKEGKTASLNQYRKTPEERAQVYRGIASEAGKLRLPEESLDGLIQRALTYEVNKRSGVLLWEFFAKHNLTKSEKDFCDPSPDALGKVMEIFPQAKSIFEEQFGSTKEFYEREGNYGYPRTPVSLGNLLLARDLNLSPEEQAMQVEFFLHDFLFHGYEVISLLAREKEVNRAIQAVIEEWEFPQERVGKVVQAVISWLAEEKHGKDYDLLTLKEIQERAALILKADEVDWSCFGAKKLAQAFARTMDNIEKDMRKRDKGDIVFVYAKPIYETKKEELGRPFSTEVKAEFEKMSDEEFRKTMGDYYLDVYKNLGELAGELTRDLLYELKRRHGLYWSYVLQRWQIIEKLIPEEESQLPFKKELLRKSWDSRFLLGGIGVELEKRQQLLEMATRCGFNELAKEINDEGFDKSVLYDKRAKAWKAESKRKRKEKEARLEAAKEILQKK